MDDLLYLENPIATTYSIGEFMNPVIKIGLVCLFVLSGPTVHASLHVSDHKDEEFIKLGKKFSSVGSFSKDDIAFGSGTLIDVKEKKLENKVVVTCAHIFREYTQEELNNIVFNLAGKSYEGKVYMHPDYLKDKNPAAFKTNIDVALFLLNKPVEDVEASKLNLETSYKDLIGETFVSVGFGSTGHYFGENIIIDSNKRASFSYAHPNDNTGKKEGTYIETETDEGDNEIKKTVNYTFPEGSVLSLSPFKDGRIIYKLLEGSETTIDGITYNKNHSLEIIDRIPVGVCFSGDSGGGCFNEQEELIGVISSGSLPLCSKVVFESKCFEKYKKEMEDLSNQNSEFKYKVVDFEKEDINTYTKPCYEMNNKEACIIDTNITVLSFHKEWVKKTIEKIIKN
jgi:hypothetical protein